MTETNPYQGDSAERTLPDGYQQPYGYQQAQQFGAPQQFGYDPAWQAQANVAQQAQPYDAGQQARPGDAAAQAYGYQQTFAAGAPQQPGQPYGYQQPGQPYGYQQPGQPYGYQQPAYQQTAPEPDNSVLYIVLSVLEFLFCGGLLAIIPFVFSLQYRSEYQAGRFEAALGKKKSAKKSLIVVLVVGILLTIALAAAFMTLGFAVYEAEQTGNYPEWLAEVMEDAGADAPAAGAGVAGALSSGASATSGPAVPDDYVTIASTDYYTVSVPASLADVDVTYQEGTMGGPTTVGAITTAMKGGKEVFEVACFSDDWGVQGTYGVAEIGKPSADPTSVVYLYVPADDSSQDMSKAIAEAQEKAAEYAPYVTVL